MVGRRGHITVAAALVTAAALLLAACGSSGGSEGGGDASTTKPKDTGTTVPAEPKANPEVDGKAFTSTKVTGYQLVDGTEIHLAFEGDHLSASAGCNSLGSAYSWDGDRLMWVGVPMATMMACEDALMAQDTWLTELLTTGVDATLDGDALTLTQGDVTIELAAGTDNAVVGTDWVLQGTIANEAMSPVPSDVEPPTLTIHDDGTAEVFAGCNRGSGTVEVADTTLTFGPIATTKMFCEGAAGELETTVLSVLDGEVDYVADGETLTITNGDAGLVYAAKG